MNYRALGRTGWKVSEISFGAWAIGADWGHVSEEDALAALHTAIELGVNFIDTADVYGDGRSEQIIAKALKAHSEKVYVATKLGRRLSPHAADGYTAANMTAFVERSLKNLQTDCLDLVQLHCPPTEVFYRPEVFGALDDLVLAGKIHYYGVSVEKVEEGLKALEYPNLQTVQIIFNMFRLRPSELFFAQALQKEVGILARVPLASGLLSGKMHAQSVFGDDDHRLYNRQGQAFDRGETFAGVDFETGLEAVEELKTFLPNGVSLSQWALRWILMFPAVSCAIPSAKNPTQATSNFTAGDLPPFNKAQLEMVERVYDRHIRELVHYRW